MGDTRTCEQCGTVFAPRREHARFCSARCRVAWNRENTGHPEAAASALQWAITAMCDTTERLPRVRPADRARAFAVISEVVWWITIVDATLVRYYPDTYDDVLAGQPRAQRELTEGTLAGLRFVRNRTGHEVDHADFIRPRPGDRGPDDGIAGWTWAPAPEPTLASLSPRGQDWELARWQAYQAQIAGQTVGEVFGRTAAFLKRAAARCALADEADEPRAASEPSGAGAPSGGLSQGRGGLTAVPR
jgi:hypothetical protein